MVTVNKTVLQVDSCIEVTVLHTYPTPLLALDVKHDVQNVPIWIQFLGILECVRSGRLDAENTSFPATVYLTCSRKMDEVGDTHG